MHEGIDSTRNTTQTAGAAPGGPTDPSHDEDLRRGILRTDVRASAPGRCSLPFLLAHLRGPDQSDRARQRRGRRRRCCSICSGTRPRGRTSASSRTIWSKASYPEEVVQPRAAGSARRRFGGSATARRRLGAAAGCYYAPGITAVGGPGVPRSGGACGAPARGARRRRRRRCRPIRGRRSSHFTRCSRAAGSGWSLFPVPDKARLQPLELHGRGRETAAGRARNPDCGALRGRAAGGGCAGVRSDAGALAAGSSRRASWCRTRTGRRRGWKTVAAQARGVPVRRRGCPARPERGAPASGRRREAVARVGDVDRHAEAARGADAVRARDA